jgi:hypothetical protein
MMARGAFISFASMRLPRVLCCHKSSARRANARHRAIVGRWGRSSAGSFPMRDARSNEPRQNLP